MSVSNSELFTFNLSFAYFTAVKLIFVSQFVLLYLLDVSRGNSGQQASGGLTIKSGSSDSNQGSAFSHFLRAH